MTIAGGRPVRGVDPDPETRCAHYRGPLDRVAIRLPCCEPWYCCHACHETLADHPASRWPPEEFGRRAVLCGTCRAELTIRGYLEGDDRCPACGAGFNPGCRGHRPLYFGSEAAGGGR